MNGILYIVMGLNLLRHSAHNFGGACSVMIITKEMDTVIRVQILDKAVYISHSTNTLGKGMNPTILFTDK